MTSILVVGSANVDLVVTTDRLPQPGQTLLGGRFATFLGGKGANQAVAAARAGGAVRFLGCVGRDEAGDRLRAGLEAEGVDVRHLLSVAEPSGTALITTVPGGDNMIVVAPGANLAFGPNHVQEQAFAEAGIVLAQLEIPVASVLCAATVARSRDATFILDPAPAAPLPPELLAQVDWLTPNESEAGLLLGSAEEELDGLRAALALRARGARGVVLTMGARGVVLLAPGQEPCVIPARAVAAVDTTAAGDAFNGAFAVALAEGAEPRVAVQFAIAAASIAVSREGAQAAMPHRDEIDALGLVSLEARR